MVSSRFWQEFQCDRSVQRAVLGTECVCSNMLTAVAITLDPATGATIGSCPESDVEDVQKAIESAASAYHSGESRLIAHARVSCDAGMILCTIPDLTLPN
jgi:hypothetical protein